MWFSTRQTHKFHLPALGLGIALLLSTTPAPAQDYMGMADLYGQGVVNSLGNQIRSAGIRSSMAREGTAQRRPSSQHAAHWPAHITAGSVSSHVFSVDELGAMNGSDSARTGQMLTGRAISVTGTVVYPSARTGNLLHLVGANGQGFQVSALFRDTRAMPRAGSRITLRGNVERVRRSVINLRNPQVTTNRAPQTVARTSGSAPTHSPVAVGTGKPDYHALRFRSSPAVTASLADRFAETLAPALAQGKTKHDLAALVRGGQLQDGFRKLLQPYGLSDRDVGDVLASHMVLIWQVANNNSTQLPRSHVLAVRNQTRESLARAGWIKAMDDADKQRFAETLSVGTMMIVGRYANGLETGNRRTVDMAMRDARDMARSFSNVDMTQYTLGDQGLMPKRR